jgi:hypothetical protein
VGKKPNQKKIGNAMIKRRNMKPAILFFSILVWSLSLSAQEPGFSVQVKPDSLLYGNQLKVVFSLENTAGSSFQAPAFEGFYVVSGPNHSSSMQIINGQVNQSSEISYYLEPKEEGIFFIGPASIVADGQTLHTEPVEVIVHPNPAGIRQSPEEEDFFRQFDAFDPWEKVFPELYPPENRQPDRKKPQKKKRKVYKL